MAANRPNIGRYERFAFGPLNAPEDAISFPVKHWDIQGELRDHVHEYPHSPGGLPEKLGRKLYVVRARALFHSSFASYKDLWPSKLSKLVEMFEKQTTGRLSVPGRGTFPAYCRMWHEQYEARIRSGGEVELEFREDQTEAVLFIASNEPSTVLSTSALDLAKQLKAVQDAQLASFAPSEISVFSAIQNAVNSVLAIRDTAGIYGNLLASRIDGLVSLCRQADGFFSMQDPALFLLIDSLHAVWGAAQDIAQDLQIKKATLRQFIVPIDMAVAQVATAIYQDASRASDLLSLNASITNPVRIPAGTKINYYPDT